MPLLAGKVIALTGAASGIGLATAHLLASRGATLSLADVNAAALDKAEKEIRAKYPGVQVLPYELDVRTEEQVGKWIETTVGVFGRLDGCANLAGVIGELVGVLAYSLGWEGEGRDCACRARWKEKAGLSCAELS